MFSKIQQSQIGLAFFCLPWLAYAMCMGHNYEAGVPVPEVILPTVTLMNDSQSVQLDSGETVMFSAEAVVDTQQGGEAQFYWCANQGHFEKYPSSIHFEKIYYVAPIEGTKEKIQISVQVSDGLGYVRGDSVFLDFNKITINPASCQLYAVDDQGLNNSQFFTVTLNPQQISELGPLHPGYDIEALAIHPQSDFIYAASGNDVTAGHPKGQLYRVDGQTGELFSVGNTGFEEIGDLAFDAQGTLWAWAKGQGLITLDVTTGAGTLVLPSTLKLAGLTLSKEAGTVFYGAVDQDLWRYDFSNQELDVVCSNLGGKTEAVEMAWGDLLLFGEHQDKTLSLHAFDPKLCQVVAEANVATPQHQDVEGIALPVGACR